MLGEFMLHWSNLPYGSLQTSMLRVTLPVLVMNFDHWLDSLSLSLSPFPLSVSLCSSLSQPHTHSLSLSHSLATKSHRQATGRESRRRTKVFIGGERPAPGLPRGSGGRPKEEGRQPQER